MAAGLSEPWTLRAHPAIPAPAGLALEAGVQLGAAQLACRYRLHGELERLRLPAGAPGRADELWRHSCCELFLAGEGEGYYEFNFAPGGAWAAYHFSAYRAGRNEAPVTPRLTTQRSARQLVLEAQLDLAALGALARAATLRIGLSAVLEEVTGELSYWALAHGKPRPDFHDPGTFVLERTRP